MCAIALSLAACASQKPEQAVIQYCSYAAKIWFTTEAEVDALEDDTVRQIDNHNTKVCTICGEC